MPDEIMKLGLELDPSGVTSGGTIVERMMLRMAAATEQTEIEITKLVDLMMTTPGAAARVETALNGVAASEIRVQTASEAMIAGMSASARVMSASESMILGMSSAAGMASGNTVKLGGESAKTERTLHILARRTGHVAGEMMGLGFGTSRAMEQLMMLGVGGVATIAITVGMALIGRALESIRSEEEKTKKETDELVKSLNEAGQARLAKDFPGQTPEQVKQETELLERLAKARKDVDESLHGSKLSNLAGVPFHAKPDRVKDAQEELQKVNTALYEFYSARNANAAQLPAAENQRYYAEQLDNLDQLAYALHHTSAEVAEYAVNFDKKLNPAQKEHIKNQLIALDLEKRVYEAMKENTILGNNKLPGSSHGAGDIGDVPYPDFLKGAGGIQPSQRAKDVLAKQAEQAQHYVDIWKSAADEVQQAIVGIFESSTNDHVISDFFERILLGFRNMLAEMAAEALRSGIEKIIMAGVGFIANSIGGPAKDALQNAGGTDGVFSPSGELRVSDHPHRRARPWFTRRSSLTSAQWMLAECSPY
jgi:hypothetical protein